jgi:hypothetical protein
MARGTVVNEPVVSQANTEAFDEGYERVFGKDRVVQPDGSDIGSRTKHRAYMKERGLASADDFSPGYYERVRKQAQAQHRKDRRETIARRLYEIDKP